LLEIAVDRMNVDARGVTLTYDEMLFSFGVEFVLEGKLPDRPLRIYVNLKSKLLVVASVIDSGIQSDPLKASSKINYSCFS